MSCLKNVDTVLVMLTITLPQPVDSTEFFLQEKTYPNSFYCSSTGAIRGIKTVSVVGGKKAFQILLHVHCRVSQWHYDAKNI